VVREATADVGRSTSLAYAGGIAWQRSADLAGGWHGRSSSHLPRAETASRNRPISHFRRRAPATPHRIWAVLQRYLLRSSSRPRWGGVICILPLASALQLARDIRSYSRAKISRSIGAEPRTSVGSSSMAPRGRSHGAAAEGQTGAIACSCRATVRRDFVRRGESSCPRAEVSSRSTSFQLASAPSGSVSRPIARVPPYGRAVSTSPRSTTWSQRGAFIRRRLFRVRDRVAAGGAVRRLLCTRSAGDHSATLTLSIAGSGSSRAKRASHETGSVRADHSASTVVRCTWGCRSACTNTSAAALRLMRRRNDMR